MKLVDQYLLEVEKRLRESKKKTAKVEETGEVFEIRDGVALLSGLDNVAYGEIVEFRGGKQAFVIDLSEEYVGVVVLGDFEDIRAGEQATATGRILSIPVSETILGRIINPLGEPQDGQPAYKKGKNYPLEKIAPGVVYRSPVDKPLQTGIKAVDALIPIGRGQRELIIGDRTTGKTTLVIDTIINQKKEDVICIYCAIGQKNSTIAAIANTLKQEKALPYTVIVNAPAADPVALQFLAPFAAAAIAEYFMDKGKDVLVVYDDLTKHAWSYRQISLILRRPAGREAYPGDIFYLHSRLLERACRLDKKYGGGSITALPIVETLEGDVSSYIPTNIISITDGQIFLETDLFNAGIRPAINVGLSVSRVGSAAQTKAVKSVSSKLKLDLAQYRELAAFSQFEGELDEETKKFLNRGAKITQILKQGKNTPYDLASQTAILYIANKGYLDEIPVSEVQRAEQDFLAYIRLKEPGLIKKINTAKMVTDEEEKALEKLAKHIFKT